MDTGKPQFIRLVDVFVLGPFMVYMGGRRSNIPIYFRSGLVLAGLLTIVLNWENFKKWRS